MDSSFRIQGKALRLTRLDGGKVNGIIQAGLLGDPGVLWVDALQLEEFGDARDFHFTEVTAWILMPPHSTPVSVGAPQSISNNRVLANSL